MRMDLANPDFVNVAGNMSETMLPEFAEKNQRTITDKIGGGSEKSY